MIPLYLVSCECRRPKESASASSYDRARGMEVESWEKRSDGTD
jgi:hypothetical protein